MSPIVSIVFEMSVRSRPLRPVALVGLILAPMMASAQSIPETPNILTGIMGDFLNIFSQGFANLLPWATTLLWTLAALEIIWAALYWALAGENFLPQLLQKTVLIGAFAYLVLNWSALAKTVMDGFISVGAMAGTGAGSGANVPDLRDPTQVLNVFWTLAQPIADYTSGLGIMDLGKIILIGFAYIILAIAIFIIAIQCALTYLEFYLVAVVATVLVPFGVNKHLSFLAERSFGAVISHGIKLAILSFILTAASPILQNILAPGAPGNPITYNLVFNLDAAALLIAFLTWHAPAIAAGLFGGGPALHAGTASRLAGTGAFMLGRMMGSRGSGVPRSSLGQIRSAAGMIGTTALAGAHASGAVVGAARSGAALASMGGEGAATRVAGGITGVTRLAADTAVRVSQSAAGAALSPVTRATASLKDAWMSGSTVGSRSGAGTQAP